MALSSNSKLSFLHFEAFRPLFLVLVKMASFDNSSSLSPLTRKAEVHLETLIEALFGTPYIGGILPPTPFVVVYPREPSEAIIRPR